MVKNGSRSGLLPDLDAFFFGIGNNGCVYDITGQIVFHGAIKVSFDGGVYIGWFSDFNVTEAPDRPYLFQLSANFTIDYESQRFRTLPYQYQQALSRTSSPPTNTLNPSREARAGGAI